MVKGLESHIRRGWESWECSHWRRQGSGVYPCVQIPNGKEWRWGSQTLHNSGHWQDKRQRAQVKTHEILRTRKHFFTDSVIKHKNELAERLWSFYLWRYLKPEWTWSWTACSSWPGLNRGFGQDDLKKSFPTSTVLWFCYSFVWSLDYAKQQQQILSWGDSICV